jgi:membrane protein implicated in regulation of membrane protease activity
MIDSFFAYLDELSVLQTCFLASMIGGGLLFLAEIIISTVGGGIDGPAEGIVQDLGTSDYAFRFFSLFSISAFLFTGGCIGMWSHSIFNSSIVSLILFILAGGVASLLIQFIMRAMLKLQTSGNVQLSNAVGQTATVYLKIPVGGKGQVEITIQDRKKILSAMTEDSEEIPTGTKVAVTSVSSSCLVVTRFKLEDRKEQ